MALFKMQRGMGGRRNMTQVATHEEGKNTLKTEEKDPQVKAPVEDPITPRYLDSFAGSPAYNALAIGIGKQGVAWAQKYILKLDSLEEINRLRAIEKNHPKHTGGRKGILVALEDQEMRLESDGQTKEEEEDTMDHECPECDFACGSVEGLEAHLSAVHDL